MLSAGLPAPTAVYYPAGNSTPALDGQAAALGIDVVISYGVSLPTEQAEGVWYVAACGALDDNLSYGYEQALIQRTTLVLTEGWSQPRELFTVDDMRISLTTLDGSVEMDELTVGTISQIQEQREQVEQERAVLSEQNAARREELTLELQSVDEELAEADRLYRPR